MKARVACAHVLAGLLRGEGNLDSLLLKHASKVPAIDQGFFRELCFGTARAHPALELLVAQLLEKPLKEKDWVITTLLESALYQLRELGTPAHAVVNEAVAACQDLKRPWARGLVNALLRRYIRERQDIEASLHQDLTFQTQHPPWLQALFNEAWPRHAAAIMDANNQRPPMTLRVNTAKICPRDYLKLLLDSGHSAVAGKLAATAIYLNTPCPVDELPGFRAGLASVQDEAAQLCAPLLDPEPGLRILDACCAPGGKSCHLLESEPKLGELVAIDIESQRLGRMTENLQRLGLDARLLAADARCPEQWWDGRPFDRILLDAPCSASGVIRRHPDIKLLRKPEDIVKLASTQHDLIGNLWRLLKPGGKMLYATCSVLPQENDQIVARHCHANLDCQVANLPVSWGLPTRHGRQLMPTPGGPDGFYYALLHKDP